MNRMKIGEVINPELAKYGKPLEGVRILAIEQMQALPFATQLLARLGADVVKVEHPVEGESGRGAQPAMIDPNGKRAGATFLRNALDKRSLGVDLKHPKGRELVLALAPHFDIVCENFKAGTAKRLGVDYEAIRAVHPTVIYLSVSGFGNLIESPYRDWPAYALVGEAMSGLYDYNRRGQDVPPNVGPAGPLGDVGTAMFAAVGALSALRHRDRTGEGQYVDVSMFDSMVALMDIVTNFWSMGMRPSSERNLISTGFRCKDGWFVFQVGREHQFERLAKLIGKEEWLDDPRFATRTGWGEHLDTVIRPAVETWAADKTKLQAAQAMGEAGIASGPCFTAPEVIADPHVRAHNMLVEMERTDDVPEPIIIPGNPIKMSKVAEGPERRVPWIGEHTEDVLRDDLGLDDEEIGTLRAEGVIN